MTTLSISSTALVYFCTSVSSRSRRAASGSSKSFVSSIFAFLAISALAAAISALISSSVISVFPCSCAMRLAFRIAARSGLSGSRPSRICIRISVSRVSTVKIKNALIKFSSSMFRSLHHCLSRSAKS